MSAPTVSVLVPLFNGQSSIEQTLGSVLGQTFGDLEAIVVDDGSTDQGGSIVVELAEREPRVRYERQLNRGPAAARNTAFRLARGRYVAFLDADDLWLPEKLERQMEAAFDGVLYTDAYLMIEGRIQDRVSDHVSLARGRIFSTLLRRNPIAILTAMLPRELLERAGGFDEDIPWGGEDFDLWVRLALMDVEFDYLPQPLAIYRVHAEGLSGNAVQRSRTALAVYEKLTRVVNGDRAAAAKAKAREERLTLAAALRAEAWARMRAGDTVGARRDLREAARLRPWSLRGLVSAIAYALPPVLRWLSRRQTRYRPVAD